MISRKRLKLYNYITSH